MSLSNLNKQMLLSFTVNQLSHTNIFLYSSGSSWNRLVSTYLYGSHNLITFFDLNSILFYNALIAVGINVLMMVSLEAWLYFTESNRSKIKAELAPGGGWVAIITKK